MAFEMPFSDSKCRLSTPLKKWVYWGNASEDQKLFSELVNALSKLMHQVCFSSGGIDSSAMQSVTSTSVASAASRAAGHESRIGGQGVSILDRAGLQAVPNFPGAHSEGSRARVRLLLLMNETEPPPIQPAFLVFLVVVPLAPASGFGR
ncbi:unnamed protein product [Effrenium voratum]|nr:unnamed protein product [Effrenium voratum]